MAGVAQRLPHMRDHGLDCPFHPEFKSRPTDPLFPEFIRVSRENKKTRGASCPAPSYISAISP